MSQEFFYISVSKGSSSTYGMTLLGSGPCVVSDVTSDGPAARAAVKPGFVVLEIDGRNVIQKGHKEVREIIKSAETKEWITFKFSTLESACQFFGNDLRTMYESCSKKRRSSGSVKSSPRKSDPKSLAPVDAGRGEAKENNAGPQYQSVAVQANHAMSGPTAANQLCDDPKNPPTTPPRTTKPIPQSRFGPEITRRSHVQQNRDLTRWMRSTEQQALNSPVLSTPTTLSPCSPSVEYMCLYYSNLVDLLGGLEESVFRKNVQYLRNYKVPPQFWARLVFTDQRLTIYRPEGKYATYSPKHMRDVFFHEDGQFFGFSTIRMSKVQGSSPTNTLDSSQTMDVFSCHILCVDPAVKTMKTKQREVLALLLGKDRALTKDSSATNSYFPENASKVVDLLENLAGKSNLVGEVKDIVNFPSSNSVSRQKIVEESVSDATENFNSASVLRNSMRKYGPYSNLQQRHSISIDSLHTLPKRSTLPAQNRYSCIVSGGGQDRSQTHVPATIGEDEVLKINSQNSTDTYDSLSSYEHDSAWTREVSSSLDLTAHTSTNVSFGDEGSLPEANYQLEKAEQPKMDLFQILNNPKGLDLFQAFVIQEHSDENINFWLACQEYRMVKKSKEMRQMAKKMFDRFLSAHAPESINVDSDVRNSIQHQLSIPTTSTFDIASKQIFDLMNNDSFPRFMRSPYYLQLRQLLELNHYNINQSMPCLNKVDSHGGSIRRESGLFSWLIKKKPDHSSSHSPRQSLPAFTNKSPDLSFQPESSPKNPIKKLIDKGRKSFSARVKPTKRESLMTFLSDSEIRAGSVESQRMMSPVSFDGFRKPMTPPPKSEAVVRRPSKPRSAGKDQKRLSFQGLQRLKTKGVTEPTEWTFSRSSLDDCLDKPPVPPKPQDLLAIQRRLRPTEGRASLQLCAADF